MNRQSHFTFDLMTFFYGLENDIDGDFRYILIYQHMIHLSIYQDNMYKK